MARAPVVGNITACEGLGIPVTCVPAQWEYSLALAVRWTNASHRISLRDRAAHVPRQASVAERAFPVRAAFLCGAHGKTQRRPSAGPSVEPRRHSGYQLEGWPTHSSRVPGASAEVFSRGAPPSTTTHRPSLVCSPTTPLYSVRYPR